MQVLRLPLKPTTEFRFYVGVLQGSQLREFAHVCMGNVYTGGEGCTACVSIAVVYM